MNLSILGFGNFVFGTNWWGDFDDDEAVRMQNYAVERGVTFFDTGAAYGNGRAERLLAQTIRHAGRDRITVSTKFGYDFYGDPGEEGGHRERRQDFSPEFLRYDLEQSLQRLEVDVIDLYQIHYPDPKTPIQETLGALSKLVDQGKVRAIGCSNFSAAQLEDAFGSQSGGTSFTTLQNEWSLLQRDVETDVIPSCEKHGISVLPYFPLASGMLTGKYRRGQGFGEGTRLAVMNDYFGSFASDENFDKVEALTGFASDAGHSLLELAIGWLASHPCVGSVIAGATTPEQTQSNVAASEWRLSQEELAKVAGILGTN